MDENLKIDQVIDDLARGKINSEEAVAEMVKLGMTEEAARYNTRSLADVSIFDP